MYDFSLFSARSLPPLTEDPDSALVCTPGQGEPLCQLDGLWHRVQVQPAYARLPGALRGCWLRRSAAERLLAAAAQQPDGYSLLVLDAWRPVRLQQALYDDFLARLRRENPRTTPWQLEKMCQEFVARPRADALRPAPHATGGAVDLTLCLDGKPVEMGTAFDDFGLLARTAALECEPCPNPQARDNRRRLFWAMSEAGFVNYPGEWWHFCYGERLWAQVTGNQPLYSHCDGAGLW